MLLPLIQVHQFHLSHSWVSGRVTNIGDMILTLSHVLIAPCSTIAIVDGTSSQGSMVLDGLLFLCLFEVLEMLFMLF